MTSKRKRTTNTVAAASPMGRVVEVVRDGDWPSSADLLAVAIEAAAANIDLTFNLRGVEYLDGSSLQTLLALARDQLKRERKLVFIQVSPALRQWFDFSGAAYKLQCA